MLRRTGNLRHLRQELTDHRLDRKGGPCFLTVFVKGNETAMGSMIREVDMLEVIDQSERVRFDQNRWFA
jgi:hypothetical protein